MRVAEQGRRKMLRRTLVQALAAVGVLAALSVGTPRGARATLSPVVTETGRIAFSIDGLGTNDPAGGIVEVEKPAGATVRKAFLSCAGTDNSGAIPDGVITVNGTGVNWD